MKRIKPTKRMLALGGAGIVVIGGGGVAVAATDSGHSSSHSAMAQVGGPGGSGGKSGAGKPGSKPSGAPTKPSGSGGAGSGGSGGAGSGSSGGPTAHSASASSGSSGGGPGAQAETYGSTGSYIHSSGTTTISDKSISAGNSDESGVLVKGGSLTADDITVKTTGNSKSNDESSFYGLNAGVLANGSGQLTMDGGSIITSGSGANDLFAYGSAKITATDTKLSATGNGAHGAMAAGGGTLTLKDLTIGTTGQSAATLATDRGGGTITATGGTFTTSGFKSPIIYSTGVIDVTDATGTATGAEAAVVEGANSITVVDSKLIATKEHGVMLYQSMSGDAQVGTGTYTMRGGSLLAKAGPAFYVTNERAIINLSGGATVTAASGVLLRSDSAGTGSGNTGAGITTLRATSESLSGNLIAAGTGRITAVLTNSTLKSKIIKAALTLHGSSIWTVSGNSTLTSLRGLKIDGSTITNIVGDDYTVTYVKADNPSLDGKTYKLSGGGTLKPA